jgi:uncharacterized phage protein (TIGR01671 family)
VRDILFRGRRRDNGAWIYGDLRHWHNGEIAIVGLTNTTNSIAGYEVDPATVGQFTGLLDKNGKKIFEGDIVTGWFNRSKIIGTITYGSDATFFISRKGLHGIGLNNAGDWLEVIGNIHDNPELLEGSK